MNGRTDKPSSSEVRTHLKKALVHDNLCVKDMDGWTIRRTRQDARAHPRAQIGFATLKSIATCSLNLTDESITSRPSFAMGSRSEHKHP